MIQVTRCERDNKFVQLHIDFNMACFEAVLQQGCLRVQHFGSHPPANSQYNIMERLIYQ